MSEPLPVLLRLTESFTSPEPPLFLAARSLVARRLSLLASGIAFGVLVMERVLGVALDADSLLLAFLGGMGLLSWWLLLTRHYAIVSWLVVGCLLVMAVVSAWTFGSVRTVNITLLLVAQVAVGLLLRGRALIWITAGSVALLGLLTWADATGALPGEPDFTASWRTWVSQGACVLGVAAMMLLSRSQMRQAQEQHVAEARTRLEAQLDRDAGRERFARVFHSSPSPIFVQSARTGTILDVNPAFEQMLGYSRKEVINRRDGFLWQHDEHYHAFARERRVLSRTAWHPIVALTGDGRALPAQICSQRDDDPHESLVITALRMPDSVVVEHLSAPVATDQDHA